jgi:dolichyl-phosphate beta-glucosyltransferase
MSFRKELRSLPHLSPSESLKKGHPDKHVSLLIPAKKAADFLEDTVSQCHEYLKSAFQDSFEIILIPNIDPQNKTSRHKDPSIEKSFELQKKFSNIEVVIHTSPRGKGAALRTGFLASKGQFIFFTDSDLPYDLKFFDKAFLKLQEGYDLVSGNRRLLTSTFDIPAELLTLAHKRHQLGLLFNKFVRLLMPIQTTDTQAGIKALSRKLAYETFSRQICPGFFFDIEFFLISQNSNFKKTELPINLKLKSEKSTVRIIRESFLATYWLLKIKLAYHRGIYRIKF